jgi:hypothetical protein
MGIGVSVSLIAVGAILAFAVNAELSGIDIEVVGIILMIAGALGLLVTVLFLGSSRRIGGSQETVIREERF